MSVAGCAAKATIKHPYGLWNTEIGQTVQVRRNGTITVCDHDVRESGVATPDVDQKTLNFGDGGLPFLMRQRVCQGRPCRTLNGVEGDVYRFVKIRDD